MLALADAAQLDAEEGQDEALGRPSPGGTAADRRGEASQVGDEDSRQEVGSAVARGLLPVPSNLRSLLHLQPAPGFLPRPAATLQHYLAPALKLSEGEFGATLREADAMLAFLASPRGTAELEVGFWAGAVMTVFASELIWAC